MAGRVPQIFQSDVLKKNQANCPRICPISRFSSKVSIASSRFMKMRCDICSMDWSGFERPLLQNLSQSWSIIDLCSGARRKGLSEYWLCVREIMRCRFFTEEPIWTKKVLNIRSQDGNRFMTNRVAARAEREIDENFYPPESAIKPEFVKRVKKAQADIAAGKRKTYGSMDEFIREIES